MTTRNNTLFAAVLTVGLTGLIAARPASAQTFTIGFENATGIPNQAAPSNYLDASNTFKDAFGGSDTVKGVTFDDTFSVFRSSYTNNVGGTDLYGPTDGNFGLANTAGGGTADTGPADAGLNGLIFSTSAVLQSAYFAANDYGQGSFGADQVTVSALNGTTTLASVSLALDDAGGNPIRTLTLMDTHAAFNPFSGQITGYRIDRNVTSSFAALGGGGNYVADDFTFTPAPEPSAPVVLAVGLFGLAACHVLSRRATRAR